MNLPIIHDLECLQTKSFQSPEWRQFMINCTNPNYLNCLYHIIFSESTARNHRILAISALKYLKVELPIEIVQNFIQLLKYHECENFISELLISNSKDFEFIFSSVSQISPQAFILCAFEYFKQHKIFNETIIVSLFNYVVSPEVAFGYRKIALITINAGLNLIDFKDKGHQMFSMFVDLFISLPVADENLELFLIILKISQNLFLIPINNDLFIQKVVNILNFLSSTKCPLSPTDYTTFGLIIRLVDITYSYKFVIPIDILFGFLKFSDETIHLFIEDPEYFVCFNDGTNEDFDDDDEDSESLNSKFDEIDSLSAVYFTLCDKFNEELIIYGLTLINTSPLINLTLIKLIHFHSSMELPFNAEEFFKNCEKFGQFYTIVTCLDNELEIADLNSVLLQFLDTNQPVYILCAFESMQINPALINPLLFVQCLKMVLNVHRNMRSHENATYQIEKIIIPLNENYIPVYLKEMNELMKQIIETISHFKIYPRTISIICDKLLTPLSEIPDFLNFIADHFPLIIHACLSHEFTRDSGLILFSNYFTKISHPELINFVYQNFWGNQCQLGINDINLADILKIFIKSGLNQFVENFVIERISQNYILICPYATTICFILINPEFERINVFKFLLNLLNDPSPNTASNVANIFATIAIYNKEIFTTLMSNVNIQNIPEFLCSCLYEKCKESCVIENKKVILFYFLFGQSDQRLIQIAQIILARVLRKLSYMPSNSENLENRDEFSSNPIYSLTFNQIIDTFVKQPASQELGAFFAHFQHEYPNL